VAKDPNDAKHVTITLANELPKDKRYQLKVGRVTLDNRNTRPLKSTLSLAMVWHQHQPSYVNPDGDYLLGPWVRKHGTKDYYDMAALVGEYPDIHVMVNLTPILLMQLENYYLARVGPFVDLTAKTVDTAGYFAQRTAPGVPVTDPWLDMLLTPTPDPASMSEQEKGWYYKDIWSNFSVSDVIIDRWPAYKALRTQRDSGPAFTQDDLLQMKGYFQLAWFDPSFLAGPVTLTDGQVVDLSDLVTVSNDTYTLKRPFTEADCQRLVVEEYKVLSNIVPVHKKLIYDAAAKTGQIEVMATPFYHPILPLLVDTDLAKVALPTTPMPVHRYQQEADAQFHVAQAARTFQQRFGKPVTGMWPAEGSVAEQVVPLFAQNHVKWVATDRLVLERSTPPNGSIYTPYRIDADTVVGDGGDSSDELAIIFRDTSISDKLGFQYQGGTPEDNVKDLLDSLRKHSPDYGDDERLLSIILDGENAWEWYRLDNDARGFLAGMYTALTDAQKVDEFRTVTVSEYLSGNTARKVQAHPTHDLPELEPLYPGSWISGSFSTWIGEDEENLAWDYLYQVRQDLADFETKGLARPALDANPTPDTPEWHAYKAWESMYAAEGSDWFWWYGSDQTAAGGDGPFDRIYLELLKSVYRHAQAAGISGVTVPDLVPILRYCEPPHGPMSAAPTIDGLFNPDDGGDASKPNEWTMLGSGACMDVDSGVGANPDDVIKTYYAGQDATNVYLALRLSSGAAARLGSDWAIRLYFSHRHIVSLGPPVEVMEDPKLATTRLGGSITMQAGGAAREVAITFDNTGALATATLATVDGSNWGAASASVGVQGKKGTDVVELVIPKAALNFQAMDPLEMLISVVTTGGTPGEVDRAPNQNAFVVHADRSKMVEVTFVMDGTGNKLALDAVKSIDNKLPPAGTGKAFIVGNLPELANWSPNTVTMYDDGTNGDESAGDNFWTFRMLVPPLTSVQYKYTIGTMGAGWGPTEEYPLTNRGFVVNDLNGDGKMVLHDVFADRPEPSGSLPPLTSITNP
jgi:alpha-amylase/alpha-mannosidase (GH57 family)